MPRFFEIRWQLLQLFHNCLGCLETFENSSKLACSKLSKTLSFLKYTHFQFSSLRGNSPYCLFFSYDQFFCYFLSFLVKFVQIWSILILPVNFGQIWSPLIALRCFWSDLVLVVFAQIQSDLILFGHFSQFWWDLIQFGQMESFLVNVNGCIRNG